jgi:hypothetical protein
MKRLTFLAWLFATSLVICPTALAAPTKVCVPEKSSTAVETPASTGECAKAHTPMYVVDESEAKALEHVTFEEKGVDEKPTIRIAGVNVQIDSGLAKESEINGTGNLIVGLNESPINETGSNNIGFGESMGYDSYGGLVGGDGNIVETEGVALGGSLDFAASGGVSLGGQSATSEDQGVAIGGSNDIAKAKNSVAIGGTTNHATFEDSSIFGGAGNDATALYSAVFGGESNEATEKAASVAGGHKLKATKEFEALL